MYYYSTVIFSSLTFNIVITITGNEAPLINGLPGKLLCTCSEGNASRVEWLSDVLLSVAYNTNHLSLTVDTTNSLDGATLTCKVTISGGIEFEESITIEVKGNVCGTSHYA